MKFGSALAAVVASLALVAAGCGGDDSSEASATDQWAEDFCAAITTWTNSLRESTDDLRSLSSLSRDDFEQSGEDIRTATETFRDDLRELGRPETESGEEAEQAIDEFADTLESDSAEIESTISGVSGITDLPQAAQDITASLSSMNEAFSSMIETVREGDAQGELETSLENADACDDLGD